MAPISGFSFWRCCLTLAAAATVGQGKVVMDTSQRPPATPNDLFREAALQGNLDDLKAALAEARRPRPPILSFFPPALRLPGAWISRHSC